MIIGKLAGISDDTIWDTLTTTDGYTYKPREPPIPLEEDEIRVFLPEETENFPTDELKRLCNVLNENTTRTQNLNYTDKLLSPTIVP